MNKKNYVPAMYVFQLIYVRLEKLGVIKLLENKTNYKKSVCGGAMDLSFNFLENEKRGSKRIALSHYFESNGELQADLDTEIRVFSHGMAEALTFQMANPTMYQRAFPDPNIVVLPIKKNQNRFLAAWLQQVIEQGHNFNK